MKRARSTPRKAVARRKEKGVKPRSAKTDLNQREEIQKLVQSLQVNQVELEHQNQELRIAEQELEESRSKYVNLFDFSPIPYFTLDPGGTIKEVNLSACGMLGVDRNRLVSRNISAHIAFEDKPQFHAFLRGVFTSSEKQSCKLSVMSKEKRVFHVSLEGVRSADVTETDPRCQIALIDMTDYKKLEEKYNKVSEELRALKAARERRPG